VKLKSQNRAERRISIAFLAKISVLEFAPNGCRKPDMLKYLISCGFSISSKNLFSRIQI